MTAIFKREFKAFFATPIGFIVLAAFYLFSGYYFTIIYSFHTVPDKQEVQIHQQVIRLKFEMPVQ